MRCLRYWFCFSAVHSLFKVATAKPQGSEYHLLKKVTLGGEGRWDYFDVDKCCRHMNACLTVQRESVSRGGEKVAEVMWGMRTRRISKQIQLRTNMFFGRVA
jgi:hypothetical protein